MPEVTINLKEEECSKSTTVSVDIDADSHEADIQIKIGEFRLLMTWEQMDCLYGKLHDWLKPDEPKAL